MTKTKESKDPLVKSSFSNQKPIFASPKNIFQKNIRLKNYIPKTFRITQHKVGGGK